MLMYKHKEMNLKNTISVVIHLLIVIAIADIIIYKLL